VDQLKVRLIDQAEPEDVNHFVRAMLAKSEALGRQCWLPPIADCSAVFEVLRGRHFVGGLVVMPVHELVVAGDDPLIMRALVEHSGRMREVLRMKNITNLIGFVPSELVEVHGKKRPGMLRMMQRARLEPLVDVTTFEGIV
jgi:hypothetical protein